MNFSRQRDEIREPAVSIIVPARNEQDCIGDCLASLQAQQGVIFELLLVDDGSTDKTRQIASDSGVQIIDPDPLPAGWSGKSNAIVSAIKHAKGKWLLLTDADTIHAPDSLQGALREADEHGAVFLSYSPHQIVTGFCQRALMPVIFAELASSYRPKDICDPTKPDAAANGQYILVRTDVYREVGGHAAVATTLLEDVALAQLVKSRGYALRFRLSKDISARMYRSTAAMWEGWTKNLVVLFQRSIGLATLRALEFTAITASLLMTVLAAFTGRSPISIAALLIFCALLLQFIFRIRKAHFGVLNSGMAIMGLPIFSLLLIRSHIHYKVKRQVMWKGRSYRYPVEAASADLPGKGVAENSPAHDSNK